MLRTIVNGAAILAFVCVVLGFGYLELLVSSQGSNSAIQHEGATHKENPAGDHPIQEREKSEDALARYTFWLTVFTGILAMATVGLGVATVGLYFAGERQLKLAKDNAERQGVEIRDQIEVARIGSRAAKESADAAIAAERARFYVVIEDHTFLNIIINAGRYPNSPQIPLSDRKVTVVYFFRNYGKTPGIINEVSHGIAIGLHPPDPVYEVSSHVPTENMISAGGRTESQPFETNIQLHTVEDALPLVNGETNFWFYGRLDYGDVFGNPQTHRFLMRYTRIGREWGFQPYDYKDYNQST